MKGEIKMSLVSATEIEKTRSKEMTEKATGAMKVATAYNPTTLDHITEGKDHVKNIKLQKAFFGEIYDQHIKEAHAMHKGLTSGKRRWTDHLDKAEDIIRTKMKTFLIEDEKRKAQEAKEREEQIRKDRDLALSKAKAKVDGSLSKINKNEDKLITLQLALVDDKTTDIEREVIQDKIDIIDQQIKNASHKSNTVAETVVQDLPPVEQPVEESKVDGVSHTTYFIPKTVTNPMMVLKQIVSGKVPIKVISFNMNELKKLSRSGFKVSGVAYEETKDLKIR
jgi:hypothetical protein